MTENNLIMLSRDYNSIQEAVNKAVQNTTIKLEPGIITEGLVIDKSINFVGSAETSIRLHTNQINIKAGAVVTFNQVSFQILSHHYDAAIKVMNSQLICKACTFKSTTQKKDLFSCIWIEAGSVSVEESNIDVQTDFIKSINGSDLILKNNSMSFKNGRISIEAHGMNRIQLMENKILSESSLLRATKSVTIEIDKNTISTELHHGFSDPRLILIDGLEYGDLFSISGNTLLAGRALNIKVSNSLSINRKINISHNQVHCNKDITATIELDHLQGSITLENNQFQTGTLSVEQCSELLLKKTTLSSLVGKNLKQIISTSCEFINHVHMSHVHYVDFKKNSIVNSHNDSEAVKLMAIDKLVFEQNKITSADHGITLLNAGDNLEISIIKNEFVSCRKRAINISSTMQKKYLKTEVNITKNIFMRNDKGVYIDDRNLKACYINDNYFGENKEAVTILGGNSTSSIKLSGNFFDESNQKIELRSAQLCHVSYNEFSDSRLSVRGTDETVIKGNHFDKGYHSFNKTYHNEVSIKSGGSLTVSHNTMLTGKVRQEKKEVMDFLNIASYERYSSISIFANKPLEVKKSKWFEMEASDDVVRYPDHSLLSTLSYQVDTKQNLADMDIDEVMKTEFFKIREAFTAVKDQVKNDSIKEKLVTVIEGFVIDIFEEKDSNDVYRFIVKSNETVEMLKIYITMADDTDSKTESRIVTVLSNYMSALNELMNKKFENDQDALKAQIKLLENLL